MHQVKYFQKEDLHLIEPLFANKDLAKQILEKDCKHVIRLYEIIAQA